MSEERWKFSTDNLKDEHKEILTDIVEYLSENGNELLSVLISKRYNLEPPEIFDIKNTITVDFFNKSNIPYSVQGYVTENGVDYPRLTISGDIRTFEKSFKDYLQINVKK
tara:strand:+ start:188 stop:517 length:330 start_codon:yes stop_codon:yes gene_type:complete